MSSAAPAGAGRRADEGTLASNDARKALTGFFVSGLLLAFLGAILPAWRHHISSDYSTIAWYFVGLIAGMLASVWVSPPLTRRKGAGWTLAFACGTAACALLYLAFVSPPISPWWRVAGLALVGLSAGVLHTAIFQAISPIYRHDPVATINLAGILFGLGCLTVALLVSGIYYVYTAPAIQTWIAVIPALFGWFYVRSRLTHSPQAAAEAIPQSPKAVMAQLRNPGAVLFSLLLFFQFGNEWAIAGWLPLFLSQRLGISPATSLMMLALYWFSLLVGRVVAQWILPRMSHARLLAMSVLASMFGCTLLLATDNRFGAVCGILMVGASFAPIYPLVVEKIGRRFPHYHPGFYNGIFSYAMAGGMLAPCTLGYFASLWGVGVVMGLPLAGSVVVFVLLLLISLEARLSAALG
ncbi:MAG TPA: MFS transporter [Bryobacteraceae bacterium]|nr:MFS transporter [Bryobacteraceae bacterium]